MRTSLAPGLIMKIYTKTGDDGSTGLFGGPRVAKDDLRIESYGTVDELNSLIGIVHSKTSCEQIEQILNEIRRDLFSVGATLASPDPEKMGTQLITQENISAIEKSIDQLETKLPPLTSFILPGGSETAAFLHQARTVCRRAERRVVTLAGSVPISDSLIKYLNRLSDLLFVLARFANHEAGIPDIPWQKKANS